MDEADTDKGGIEYVTDIIQPEEDKRSYKALTLESNLRILLISDPETDKSAASLRVNVGSMSDPDDLPGLAHFCEHVVFMGSEKYPRENEFRKYLSDHGGNHNGTTFWDHTNFSFDIMPEYLEGALDIFAQLFLCPLFTEDAVEREVNAVNSEYENKRPNDSQRSTQVQKSTSKDGHPFRQFSTGNLETLSNTPKEKEIDVREELIKFHEKWYSSNIMTTAILGKENLEDLEKMAVPLFSNVINKDVERPIWTDHPYGPEQLQKKIYIVPLQDIRTLELYFPIPDLHEHYKSRPEKYLSHLIKHEGPGSILSALKAKGWSDSLSVPSPTVANGFGLFTIDIGLTEEGIEKIDEIINLVFQYLNKVKEGFALDLCSIFEEIQLMSKTNFRFKGKEDPRSYVMEMVNNMEKYPPQEVLCGPYYFEEWKPELVQEVLGYLKPSNMRVTVVGKKFEPIADLKEEWYGTKYKIEEIPESTLQEWETCGENPELTLPPANEFLPSNFEILYSGDQEVGSSHPFIIQDSAITRTWFKQDDTFLLPKAELIFEFFSPLACSDPSNSAMTNIFIELLKDSLAESTYNATLAGIYYEIRPADYGMILKIKGFNDKQNILLEKISEKIAELQIEEQRFNILKEKYIRKLKNLNAEQPEKMGSHYLRWLLTEQIWSNEEILEACEKITLIQLEEFIPQFLSELHIECLIHGNVNEEQALALVEILEEKLTSRHTITPLPPQKFLRKREIQLTNGSHFNHQIHHHYHKSCWAIVYYQCSTYSTQNNMLIELLYQILNEPCFNILRTKEQLGYNVFRHIKRSDSAQGLIIIVQSDKHPIYVDQRIEAFLVQFREMVNDMSLEEFEKHKEALASNRLQKPKNLSELTDRFWDEIRTQQYHFNRVEDEVAYLKTITKEDFLDFFDDYIKFEAPNRRKLAVHVLSKVEGSVDEPDAEFLSSPDEGLTEPPPYTPPRKIEDVTEFKESHDPYPVVEPHSDFITFRR